MSFLTTLLPAAAKPATGNFLSDNFLTIALVAVLVIMVLFMVRNSRKRKRDAEELQSKFVPGAEVMTQHGIYGTLVSVDEEKNEAIIETTPGTRLRVHRQTVARVIEPQDIAPEKDIVEDEPTPAGEPEYGERIEADKASDAAEKPARAPRTSATSSASKSSTTKAGTTKSSTAKSGAAATSAAKPRTTASSSPKPRTSTKKPAGGDTAD
jgi:preprotein translocase subunit YajC